MDFDLNFGRFFGPQIDVFEKLVLPDFELQLEVRSAKIVILPTEKICFNKIDISVLSRPIDQKNVDLGDRKSKKNHQKSI